MNDLIKYKIFPLGDNAVTINFGNIINEDINKEVIARFNQLQQQPLPGVIETVPAYSSLTVYYDVFSLKKTVPAGISLFDYMKQLLDKKLQEPAQEHLIAERVMKVPVCYETGFAADIKQLALAKNISIEEVIQIHTSKMYKVYMLGFLPGFPYMGELDEKIAMPRKPQPVNIAAGSVGIAGKQTGIYPLDSPGGWQIIGRTPLQLFDGTKEEATLLRAGDTVQFYSISKDEFQNY